MEEPLKKGIKKASIPERHIGVDSNELDKFPDVIKSMYACLAPLSQTGPKDLP